jgi:osmotically-inducible protein OsmY
MRASYGAREHEPMTHVSRRCDDRHLTSVRRSYRHVRRRPTLAFVQVQLGSRTLADDVLEALRWDPRIDATKVDVEITDGTAVVKGAVHTLRERGWCEEIVKRVRGITAVRNELDVRLTIGDYRTDETLQRVIGELFEALAGFGAGRPDVSVSNGWVTLRGSVRRRFQKHLAERSVSEIAGVRGVTNFITIDSTDRIDKGVKVLLGTTLRRRLPDCSIRIGLEESRLILRGTVRTCAERDDVIDLAWCAPGVTAVEDRLVVRP